MQKAPVKEGKEFGPCLLWPSATGDRRWIIGRWTGTEWCDEEGWTFRPLAYALLPDEPTAAELGDAGSGPVLQQCHDGLHDVGGVVLGDSRAPR